jgi:hypothetical protein
MAAHAAESGCRTGGDALANAYVRASLVFAYFFGDLPTYVVQNEAHFGANGDAVRCAAALSEAFLASSAQLYNPEDVRRQQQLNDQLGKLGIPGAQQPTVSAQLYMIGVQLARLARTLPALTGGNAGPFYTATNMIESQLIQADQMFSIMMRNPMTAQMLVQILSQNEALFRRAGALQYQIIFNAATEFVAAQSSQ